MRTGTKSLLFGVHAFWLHPFAVAYAWWGIHGFPFDPRLWIAFIVHDWGYWGCRKMDDFAGKCHPQTGARIMRIFGREWEELVLYHSRHYAKMLGHEPSKLCGPDKVASVILPAWLYLTLATLSGEIHEYMGDDNCRVLQAVTGVQITSKRSWFAALRKYLEGGRTTLPSGGI